MRILVLNLTAGGLSGGYRKYLETLMPLLRADARITRLDVVVPPAAADSLRDSMGPLVSWPEDATWPSKPVIRRLVHEAKPDVVFIPTARWIACDGLPVVNMVRNMEPLVHPIGDNSVADAARNIARAWLSRRSVHRASRVIAVSNFVRDFLIARWNVPAGRIGVVPHGVAPTDVREDDQRDAVVPGRLRELDASQFLFAAGSVRSSRGLEDSIRALALLAPQYPAMKLVVAGAADPGTERYERDMKRLAQSAGVGERVVWTGHLGPAEMAWCYRRSAAFIMTSRVEACPNIALEAMSHGALCLSTQNPPMPEFFGDAAAYYPAGDASALARLVDRTLHAEASDVAASRETGRRRSLRYSWSETAELTVGELLAATR